MRKGRITLNIQLQTINSIFCDSLFWIFTKDIFSNLHVGLVKFLDMWTNKICTRNWKLDWGLDPLKQRSPTLLQLPWIRKSLRDYIRAIGWMRLALPIYCLIIVIRHNCTNIRYEWECLFQILGKIVDRVLDHKVIIIGELNSKVGNGK